MLATQKSILEKSFLCANAMFTLKFNSHKILENGDIMEMDIMTLLLIGMALQVVA